MAQVAGCTSPGTVQVSPKLPPILEAAEQHYRDGRYAEAAAAADQAASELALSGDTTNRIEALHVAGRSLRRMGRYAEAQARHQSGLDLARAAGNRQLEARALIDLGELHERQKDHESAITAFEASLKLLEQPRDHGDAGRALAQLGDIYVARGAFDSAFRAYSSALQLAQKADDLPGTATYQDYLGYFFRRLGDHASSIDQHTTALGIAGKLKDARERDAAIARAHNHLGINHLEMGIAAATAGNPKLARSEFDKAVEHEQTALTAAEAAGDRWRQGYVLRALSSAYRRRAELATGAERDGGLRSSHELGLRALQLAVDMSELEWKGLALHELAATEARSGDLASAKARMREAVGLWTTAGDLKSLGYAHLLLAQEVLEREGGVRPAIAEYGNALKAFDRLLATEDQATAWYRIGDLQERSNDLNEAEKSYEKSIEALESIRSKLTRQEHKLNFYSARLRPYEALFKLLMRRYAATGQHLYAERAFHLSERSRSQTLLDLVQGANDRFRAGVSTEVIQQEHALRARFYNAYADLANERDDARRGILHEKIEALSHDYAEFEANVQKSFPAYAQLKNPPIFSSTEVAQRVLRPGEMLIEYFVSREETYAFVVDTNGLRRVVSLGIGQGELTRDVETLRRPFEELKKNAKAGSLADFDLTLSKKLHDKLLAPLDADIREASRLLIVPHGPLFYIPFEMLVVGPKGTPAKPAALLSEFEQVVYFIETAPPIAYALSASLLNPDLADRGAPAAGEQTLLGIGNPTSDDNNDEPGPLTIRGQSLSLSPLPQSEIEVKQVAELYGRNATVFLRNKATKSRFLRQVSKHRVLLLSTHGILDEDYPMLSGLVFAPTSAGGEPELLQTFEIFDLTLNSEFVVLSACEIGLGSLREGEGLLSIGRGFFYAGAGSLAVTLWSVEDLASSQLVTGMFSQWKQASVDEAAALRHSKLAFLGARRSTEQGELATSHPFFWAPFVIIEGPRRRR